MCKSLGLPHDLVLYKTISTSKFPVILVKCPVDATEYIIKAFTKDSHSRSSYLREKQFLSTLNHPNIINYVPETSFHLSIPHRTFIMMEYAPYGDFFNLVLNGNLKNEKLIRTYFHQLIQGIEHLHEQGIAHLDIKLENLLLGKDLLLKIADFDVAQYIDEELLSQGSENYRAPEIRDGTCTDYCSADIFSAGVCLFILMSRAFPFVEEGNEMQGKFQSYEQFVIKSEGFWKGIEALLRKKSLFSQSLRQLLNGMWAKDPTERFTIEQIKKSAWYNESVYTREELADTVKEMFDK